MAQHSCNDVCAGQNTYDHLNADAVLFAHDPQTESFIADVRCLYPDRLRGDKTPSCSDTSKEYLTSRDDLKQNRQPLGPEMLARLKAAGPSGLERQYRLSRPRCDDVDRLGPGTKGVSNHPGACCQTWFELLRKGRRVRRCPTWLVTEPVSTFVPHAYHVADRGQAACAGYDTTVLFDQVQVAQVTLAGRQEAHDLARQIAAAKGDLGYKVDDPRAMAQAFVWVLVQVPVDVSGLQAYRLQLRNEIQQTPIRK